MSTIGNYFYLVLYVLCPSLFFSPWQRLSGASLLIFANKQDIQGALSPDEIAKVLNLEAMDNSRHWRIVGTGDGLLEGFDWLVQNVASRIYMLD
ncbi:ADP-ribosylation factor-like protein 2 [Datura stramonium]|uniref:ADP-ribosylation factor-like protein 2 n=1 Tax=Datura stramonium TaxID=4076 RepID=A0ABS8TH79_DATST|nr:ADP-ribosylation factor-like protein 2 [Datura stramonium]